MMNAPIDLITFKRMPVGITDFKKTPIHEGDIMKWPKQKELGVVRYEINSCQFRAQFDPVTYIPSCHLGLNTNHKGRAVVIGSVYDNAALVPWAVPSKEKGPKSYKMEDEG